MQALTALRDSPAATAATDAWRWWTGELLAMVPDRFRPHPDRRPRADIRPGRDSVRVEIVREGVGQLFAEAKRIEELDGDGWAELASLAQGSRTRIVLEPHDCFTTGLTLPAAARRRLRPAVALQLSQVSPLDPALVRWAMLVADGGTDKVEVRVAMARAERIEQLQALFEEKELDVPPVCAPIPDGVIELARGRKVRGAASAGIGARSWALAALLVASIPFTTLLGATILRSSNESRVEQLERGAGPRIRAEADARRSEALRRDLRPLFARPGISATLEEVAARLPLTDHVKTIGQGNDRILVMTIETPDAEAAEGALKGSRLLPHIAVTDISPSSAGKLAVTFRTSPR
ncbi:MAG TPA: hypothetical protein VK472_02475 [Allosphingosinicella sp.]|nr:hypothetical protein [Allosphingosinicella sp.]